MPQRRPKGGWRAIDDDVMVVCALMFSITFSDAAATLASTGTAVTLAEAHGCLCGALCGSHDYSFAQWCDELLDSSQDQVADDDQVATRQLLQTLYSDTIRALRGDQMEFAPFLPEDELPLTRRAEALAQWCQGFLYGLGSVSVDRKHLTGEVEEILRDLSQIARASAGESEPTEEDEADYVEIVEYIRAGVQLVHDELRPTLQ